MVEQGMDMLSGKQILRGYDKYFQSISNGKRYYAKNL